jgi:hypothetical protein
MAMPLEKDASIKVTESGQSNPRLNGFSVSFKTTNGNGLIFVNQPEDNKYVGVYLKAGKPVVEAQIAASTPIKVTFADAVNDNKDHVVTVIWEAGKVTASLDKGEFKSVDLVNSSQAFIYGKMQIGSGANLVGLSGDANTQFTGCINYVKLPDRPLTSSNFKLGDGIAKDCSV